MDASKVNALASTSVNDGTGSSFISSILGLAVNYGEAAINNKYVNQPAKDTAVAEAQIAANAKVSQSQQVVQSVLIGGAVLLAAVVLYKVL